MGVEHCIWQAYAAHVVTEDGVPFGAPKPAKNGGKKGGWKDKGYDKGYDKGGGKGWQGKKGGKRPPDPMFADVRNGVCRDFLLEQCYRGETCKFEHDDAAKTEFELKRALDPGDGSELSLEGLGGSEGAEDESDAKR